MMNVQVNRFMILSWYQVQARDSSSAERPVRSIYPIGTCTCYFTVTTYSMYVDYVDLFGFSKFSTVCRSPMHQAEDVSFE
jgi:hypothetical protein